MWNIRNEHIATDLYQLFALVLQLIEGTNIFYYNPDGLECHWWWFLQQNLTNQPQWVWHSQALFKLLKDQHNNDFVVLACLSEQNRWSELMALFANLSHLRQTRVLIELANQSNSNHTHLEESSVAALILSQCLQHSMLHVALYFQRWARPLTFYSFEAFPQFKLLQRLGFATAEQLYPKQLQNLKGYTLRAIPDHSPPNTIYYCDAAGQTHLTGYMWKFMQTFAEKLNATLDALHPTWKLGHDLSTTYMLEFTKNGSVDFGLATLVVTNKYSNRYYQYSYPIMFGKWCIMLPLERPIEMSSVFGCVLQIKAFVLMLIVLSCCCLSIWLGAKCFPSCFQHLQHCLRLTPSLIVVLIRCVCKAQLLSLMVMSPEQTIIDSFDALLVSNVRILHLTDNFNSFEGDFKARYASGFRLTSNITEFFNMRSSFNTSYAYSISTFKWTVMYEQQQHFQRPLFRFSELCLSDSMSHGILLAEESIYREVLKLFTMRMYESGLIDYWLRHSFIDMVKAGLMSFKDYSMASMLQPLRLQDFQLAWYYCGIGLLLAIFVFVAELLWFYCNVCLDSL